MVELKKNKVYFIRDHDFKIKKFVLTSFGDGRIIQGYIIGEGKIHSRNISWLQDNPLKLKKVYLWALKQYRKNGHHKKIGILSKEYFKYLHSDIRKEVLIEEKEYSRSGTLIRCINSNGMVEYINQGWFEKA